MSNYIQYFVNKTNIIYRHIQILLIRNIHKYKNGHVTQLVGYKLQVIHK